jgi:hypothetical protein
MELVRIFLSLAASRKSHIHLVDIKTAYLNGILDEEIYAVVPDGMKSHASGNRFMRLLRAIYGLKQSGRIWALLLQSTLKDLKLIACEKCVYFIESLKMV